METKKFKTNVRCGGCVAKVKASLDKNLPDCEWSIDTSHPHKIFTITSDYPTEKIVQSVQEAGYTADPITD